MIRTSETSGGPGSGKSPVPAGMVVALAVGTVLLVFALVRVWNRPGPETAETGDPAVGAAVETSEFSAAERGSGRRAPFRRISGSVATPPAMNWLSRIGTNGVAEFGRAPGDQEYHRRLSRHVKIRSLLRSPARDTPECQAVIDYTLGKGMPLAASVDLYRALWSTRMHERRVEESTVQADRDAMTLVREMELGDLQSRFKRDFDVDVMPLMEELVESSIRPTVYFGAPDLSVGAGEPLLTD